MARDGSLQAFLLTVEQCLARKLRRREQEMLAELALAQQQLCALRTDSLSLSLSVALSLSLSLSLSLQSWCWQCVAEWHDAPLVH